MKKRKCFLTLSIVLLAAVLMAGCSDGGFGEQTLLRPPRATGDKAQIQTIISEQAGGGYILKYPRTGDYRSAITMFETKSNTGAMQEYAVALYAGSNDTKLSISIIAHKEDEWECLGSFSNVGAGVDRVLIEDINNDGTDEILVGWSGYNTSRNTISAYSMESGTVREMLIDEAYTEMVIADITDDKSDDIVLLSLRNAQAQSPSTATLLQYSDQEKKPIGKFSVELDSEINSFTKVTVGTVEESKKGIFIDGDKSSGVRSTQVVYYSALKNSLVNPLLVVSDNGSVNNATSRKDNLTARDFDGDGMIEVPVVSQLPAPPDANAGSVCSLTSWRALHIQDNSLKTKMNTVINYTDGYYFVVPDVWVGNFTVLNDPENRQMSFYLWNSKSSYMGDKLLTLYRFSRSGWNSADKKGLVLIEEASGEKSDTVIAAALEYTKAEDEMNLTEEQLHQIVKKLT